MRMTPTTPEEWQEAADAAVFSLALDAAWKYGLIRPDPDVDVARCEQFIVDAPAHGAVIRSLDEVLAGSSAVQTRKRSSCG
jgi:hypothetical protein